MKPFRFRLDRLLTLRENEVTAAQFVLARAMAQEETSERALVAATALRRQRLREMAALEQSGTTGAELAHSRRYIEALGQAQAVAESLLAAARAEVDRCRAELIARQQDSRTLDKLKAARREAYRAEGEGAHQREVDDLAAGRLRGAGPQP